MEHFTAKGVGMAILFGVIVWFLANIYLNQKQIQNMLAENSKTTLQTIGDITDNEGAIVFGTTVRSTIDMWSDDSNVTVRVVNSSDTTNYTTSKYSQDSDSADDYISPSAKYTKETERDPDTKLTKRVIFTYEN